MTRLLRARQQFYQRADWSKATADYVAEHDIDLAAVNAYAGLVAVVRCHFIGNGHFDLDDDGTPGVVIEILGEDDETIIDLVAWPVDKPETFATMFGASALGMARVVNPATWAFGGALNVWRTPLRWLQAGCQGCVILDHRNVASWLREALGTIGVEDIEHAKQVEAMLNLPDLAEKADPGAALARKAGRVKTDLRAYQSDVISQLQAVVANGAKRVLLVAPTGAGKTVIASALIAGAVAKGKSALMVAHRRELIDQAYRKLDSAGLRAGTILADDPRRDADAPVQVGSIQTIHVRAIRGSKLNLPRADLLIVDEAHRIRARTYRQLLDAYPNAVVVGLSATPCRGDGRGLGNVFDTMVQCPAVGQLIDLGYLVPTVVYAPSTPDLKGVKVRAGDYIEAQLAARMDVPKLVGDIVTHWHRLAEGRKTVVFATSVAHSRHIADEFSKSGVAAAHLDGNTPTAEREVILAKLSSGELTVVANNLILCEGWDQPDVSCCVLARPTKHQGLYRQQAGRVLRPSPGEDHALILDHAGSTFLHGRAEDHVEWTLDEDKRAEAPAHALRQRDGSRSRVVTCHRCSAIRMAGEPCPQCGWYPKSRADSVEFIDGELARVDRKGRVLPTSWPQAAKNRFFGELLWYAGERGFKRGWASYKYKERIGHWPPVTNPPPAEPSPETLSWIRSRTIAWAKSKSRAA